MTAVAHRSAEQIGRTDTGPRPLPALGPTREVPLPDAVEHTLPNGLRVLAARRAAVPMVELRLRVPFAGDEPDHSAVAELLTSTLLTGTATRDRVEIDDELAVVGADLGVSVDPEKLWISGSGLASGFGQMLEVLVDVLTAATHPDNEVTRERERLVERITLARAQPRTIAR
jgi:zinc protease